MSAEDALLVSSYLQGEQQAVQDLIERFQAKVFGLCSRLLPHRQDAEAVTIEVFLRVFRSLKRWEAQRPLQPWIMGIAVNSCRTWLGERARRPEFVQNLQNTLSQSWMTQNALANEILMALRESSFEHQCVFVMYHEQGQRYDEIAEALGEPVETIKTWLRRARLEILGRLRPRSNDLQGQ